MNSGMISSSAPSNVNRSRGEHDRSDRVERGIVRGDHDVVDGDRKRLVEARHEPSDDELVEREGERQQPAAGDAGQRPGQHHAPDGLELVRTEIPRGLFQRRRHLRQPELDNRHRGGGQQHRMREDDAVELAVKAEARQQTQQRHPQNEWRYQDRKDQNRRRQDSAGKDEPVERVRREEADDRGCRRRDRRDQEAVQQRVEEDPVLHQLAVPLERPPLQRKRGVDVLLEREEDQKRNRQQQEDEAEKEVGPAREAIAVLAKMVIEAAHRHTIRCLARSAMR